MLAWILRHQGIDAGYLVGAVAEDLVHSADLGTSEYFVIEADEYDTAFFDKRAKFLHYQPKILILNNLEHDHLDIYPKFSDVQRVFHHLLRQLPAKTEVIVRHDDKKLRRLLRLGFWSQLTWFNQASGWHCSLAGTDCAIYHKKKHWADIHLQNDTDYNRLNALAALLAADKCRGSDRQKSIVAINAFRGVKRRLQIICQANQTSLYEDFAHHPTSIAATIDALKDRSTHSRGGKILALVELASYSMRKQQKVSEILASLAHADKAWIYVSDQAMFDSLQLALGQNTTILLSSDVDVLIEDVYSKIAPGDTVAILSNRNFDGYMPHICQKLCQTINNL